MEESANIKNKYLLASIPPGKWWHPCLKKFLESLPKGTKAMRSRGYIINKEGDFETLLKKDDGQTISRLDATEGYRATSDYLLYSTPQSERFSEECRALSVECFALAGDISNPERLGLCIDISGKTTLRNTVEGSVEKILGLYDKWSNFDPETILQFEAFSLDMECMMAKLNQNSNLLNKLGRLRDDLFKGEPFEQESKSLVAPTTISLTLYDVKPDTAIKEKVLGPYNGPLYDLEKVG